MMREFGMVTRPMSETLKKEVVAEPILLVDEATSKRRLTEPNAPWIERRAHGVVVPIASALVVLFQLNWVLSPANAVPFANWTAPVPPAASVALLPTHTPFTAKHPPVKFTPPAKVLVAEPVIESCPVTPRLVVVALVEKSVVAVSAVDDANGSRDATSVEVAMKYDAVGVLVEV